MLTVMPQSFKDWRIECGLTQRDAARALGLTPRTIKYLDKGVNGRGQPYEPTPTVRRLMAMIQGEREDQPDLFGDPS